MSIDNITKLLENTDHPVVESYLIAFVGYPDDLESATRDDILRPTLTLDIDLNIRLNRLSVEFFDDDGELMPVPEHWKAQQLLGFESTYRCVTLEKIIADIADYERTPNKQLWPWYTDLCVCCNGSRSMHDTAYYCKACNDRNW